MAMARLELPPRIQPRLVLLLVSSYWIWTRETRVIQWPGMC